MAAKPNFRSRVRRRPNRKCSLKRHTNGCLREVIGYLEKLAANSPDRVVWASFTDIRAHCKKDSKKGGEGKAGQYGKSQVLAALNLAEEIGLVDLVIRRGRVARIIANHDSIHSVEDGECVLNTWSLDTARRRSGQTRNAQLLGVKTGPNFGPNNGPNSGPEGAHDRTYDWTYDRTSADGQVVDGGGTNWPAPGRDGQQSGDSLAPLALKPSSPLTRKYGRGLFGVFSNEEDNQPFVSHASHSNGAPRSPVSTATDHVNNCSAMTSSVHPNNNKEGDISGADGGAGEEVAFAVE